MGVHLTGVLFTGVLLMGAYLMGVRLIGGSYMDLYMFPNLKRFRGNLWIPYLTNGGRFVEV